MTAYYTQDAQLMADDMPPIRGHAAIREFWKIAPPSDPHGTPRLGGAKRMAAGA